MNCKRGDLALVVGGARHVNVGKLVTCLELMPAGTQDVDEGAGPLWRVDRPMEYGNEALPGVTVNKYLAADKLLMPIRPDAGRHGERELASAKDARE